MSDLQILTKAIQKAQKNGFRYILNYDDENGKYYIRMLDLFKYKKIIFDPQFAEAFYGRKQWTNRLNEMYNCEKPLEYVRYFLGE